MKMVTKKAVERKTWIHKKNSQRPRVRIETERIISASLVNEEGIRRISTLEICREN